MKNQHAGTIISIASTVLVFGLALVAFILSFDALQSLAAGSGVASQLAWMFPVAIDGFVVAAALAALRANLHGERAWYPNLLVGAFTLASAALNVTHSNGALVIPRQWLATIVAAVPPLALVLASELLFAQIRSIVRERAAIAALVDVQARYDKLTQDASELTEEIEKLRKTYRETGVKIKNRQAELVELAKAPETATDALLAFYADNPLASQEVAGKAVGRSRSWVGQQLARMKAAQIIKVNGSGVEVLAVRKEGES